MSEITLLVAGLPESGKTTYLAALWHLVTSQAHNTKLKFNTLEGGDNSANHLRQLSELWRAAKVQVRTEIPTNRIIAMNLRDRNNNAIRLTFPDMSGESYRAMWEGRDCSKELQDLIDAATGVMLFVNADAVTYPTLAVTACSQAKSVGAPLKPGTNTDWDPRKSPTQVQLIEMLQLMRIPPISSKVNRVAVVLSLWDKVSKDKKSPDKIFAEKLPLLYQYLTSKGDGWEWKAYGISAQGGDYLRDKKKYSPAQLQAIEKLKDMNDPVERIRVVFDSANSHDLTEPLAWLIE
jgi:hypothetical protein